MRRCHYQLRLIATVAAVVAAVAPIGATAATLQTRFSRSIAVGVPAEPVSLRPGHTAQLPIRVINPGTTPVTVTVKGEGVALGNAGKVTLTGRPDPLWAGRETVPSGEYSIEAQSYVDLTITVHMPLRIAPDLYFIGFLVTPVASGSGVVQVNQIGSFVTINVPGPRTRSLAAVLYGPTGGWHIGNVVIGSGVDGTLVVRNTGKSAVQFWGENDVSTFFNDAPGQKRLGVSLLPIGRYRSFPATAGSSFPLAVVTMAVSVVYPRTTQASTRQIAITRSYWVINPWLIGAVFLVIVLSVVWRGVVRPRRPRKRPRLARARAAGSLSGR